MASATRLPTMMKKLVVTKLSSKFREAVELVKAPLPQVGPKDILVKNRYLGINASDINFTAGRYFQGAQPPFDCGFEAVGEVVQTGPNCKLGVGQAVLYSKYGAFSEYIVVPEKEALALPEAKAEYVPLLVSGLTAAISLDKMGDLKPREKVLVSAAAGGTGQYAVQLAKMAGCHVIGTCSTEEKAKFLKNLGCDRVIVTSKEELKDVLISEYKDGVDVVYESVGGKVYDTCVNALGVKGRLIIIGFISGYDSELGFVPSRAQALPAQLLSKSASIRGFFLAHYLSESKNYLNRLVKLYTQGELKSYVDNGINAPVPLKGIESIADAVEYLYSRKSLGKIVVDLSSEQSKL